MSPNAFTFGRVCRTWREVANMRKDVWSSLQLSWPQCMSMLIARESATSLTRTLSLSGNHPLNLQLLISAPTTDVNGRVLRIILGPIFSQSRRWQKFALTCSSEALETITFFGNPFNTQLSTPLLKHFTIQSDSKNPHMNRAIRWSDAPFMNCNSAPALRAVTFLNDAMMFMHLDTLPWAQLHELDLLGLSVSIGLDEYSGILRNAKHMRKLRIAVDRSLESNEPIVLDNLEILHIVEHGSSPDIPQYHSVMCEKLVELSVEYTSDRTFDDDAEQTLADILGPILRLRRLYLQNVPLSEDGLIRTLSHCPYLDCLGVSNNESSDFRFPLTNQSLLQLTISRKRTLLRRLEYASFASKACSVRHIENFVASRWDVPDTITRLRGLVYSSLGTILEATLLSQMEGYIDCGLEIKAYESEVL